jgi:hypothetical protein
MILLEGDGAGLFGLGKCRTRGSGADQGVRPTAG